MPKLPEWGTRFFVVIRVPSWGADFGDARYYGWRYAAHIGPVLLFFWPCTPAP